MKVFLSIMMSILLGGGAVHPVLESRAETKPMRPKESLQWGPMQKNGLLPLPDKKSKARWMKPKPVPVKPIPIPKPMPYLKK
ncbi:MULTISPECIES: hypothetical protein [unclassified Fictibacillus]|uniref:hypothetical protein n=1 Tax=unclassified Fictibacillus TaxID=2644029 RepID=UPI0007861660|nr:MULTISPECIES: hypothetical protein [unclassified Fictibacillus]MED2971125.1 hypothetical protein [Fictibacillus sp. B-59209]UZJ79953.1 hypothetical protein OKX00_05615 [Fictibacillus sp. KU28468]